MPDEHDTQVTYEVFSLATIFSNEFSTVADSVRAELEAFNCARSPHIQDFAREGVHRWEKHGNSRTYLMLNSDTERIKLLGFFTVGMASFNLTLGSTSNRKKLMGDITMDQTGAFTIAELARSDDVCNAELPGSVILDEAKEVVRRARAYIGGRFLVVDSRMEIFQRLYEPAGFKEVHVATPPRGMEDADFVTSCCIVKDWT